MEYSRSWGVGSQCVFYCRTEGQFAAFQDCLYRSMSSAKWLLVVDTDEVLMPRRERTLLALLESLSASYTPAKVPAAFLFRNAFFYVLWEVNFGYIFSNDGFTWCNTLTNNIDGCSRTIPKHQRSSWLRARRGGGQHPMYSRIAASTW